MVNKTFLPPSEHPGATPNPFKICILQSWHGFR